MSKSSSLPHNVVELSTDQINPTNAVEQDLSVPVTMMLQACESFIQQKQYGQAKGILAVTLKSHPEHVESLLLAARLAQFEQNHVAALQRYEKAYSIAPEDPEVLFYFGGYLLEQKQSKRAAQYLSLATKHQLDNPDIWRSLAKAYEDTKVMDKAIAANQKLAELKPDDHRVWLNLGRLCHLEKLHDDALKAYQSALKIAPDHQPIYNNLGALFRAMKRLDEAEKIYKKALSLKPNSPGVLYNMGNLMREQGRLKEAINYFEEALVYDPQAANIHWNLSLSLLSNGNIKRGFQEYRWRWEYNDFPTKKREFMVGQWDGTGFYNQTLLIYLEQGMGDLIQFARWIPSVVARKGAGSKIILECHAPLKPLFETIEGVDLVIEREDPHPKFDMQIPYLTLPAVFEDTLATMPREVPYLTVPSEAKKTVPMHLMQDKNLKVGLVWAGNPKHKNDHNRSSQLTDWQDLFKMENVSFYSLQKGPQLSQLEGLNQPELIKDLGSDFTDMAMTAAVIEQLDLVISVDTSVAHLAGSLGKPVWVLVPYSADWRWMVERDDSPWYPSARLFRQDESREWASVYDPLRQALLDLAYYKKTVQKDRRVANRPSPF